MPGPSPLRMRPGSRPRPGLLGSLGLGSLPARTSALAATVVALASLTIGGAAIQSVHAGLEGDARARLERALTASLELAPDGAPKDLAASRHPVVRVIDARGVVRAGPDRDTLWPIPAHWQNAIGHGGARLPLVRHEHPSRPTTLALGRRSPRASGRPPEAARWVVAELAFTQAYAPLLAMIPVVVGGGLAAVLLSAVAGYAVGSASVRPIERLAAAARRISQGGATPPLDLEAGSDEVGLLARTVRDMLQRLQRQRAEIETAYQELKQRNQELQRANEVLSQLSITDGLTRLHNHRFFQDQLGREVKRAERTGDPLALILADIDDFKQLNDRYGHAAGDDVLRQIAEIMNESIRESDFVARYGGEEFVVIATGTTITGATTLAEKIRLGVAESHFELTDSPRRLRVTMSLGVALYRGDARAFFREADRALYRAKSEGKYCVIVESLDVGFGTGR